MRRSIFLPAVQKRLPFCIFRKMPPKDVNCRTGRFCRVVQQRHVGFCRTPPALAVITGGAGSDNIFPGVPAAQVPRYHMIYGQVERAFAAILAGKVITPEDFAAVQPYPGAWPLHHFLQANDRWARKSTADGVNNPPAVYHQRSPFCYYQADRSPQIAHVDRLKVGVENQHVFAHFLLFRLIIARVSEESCEYLV